MGVAMTDKEKLESAEAEIARLENICRVQQVQVRRLMLARDAEHSLRRAAVLCWSCTFQKYESFAANGMKRVPIQRVIDDYRVCNKHTEMPDPVVELKALRAPKIEAP